MEKTSKILIGLVFLFTIQLTLHAGSLGPYNYYSEEDWDQIEPMKWYYLDADGHNRRKLFYPKDDEPVLVYVRMADRIGYAFRVVNYDSDLPGFRIETGTYEASQVNDVLAWCKIVFP